MTDDASIRAAIVEAARGELGPGDVREYWRSCGVPPPYPQHWCGAFALWALHQAGVALDQMWDVGVGFVAPCRLRQTRQPLPGDIAYTDVPWQHHAIVESLAADGMLTTIDGNQPDVRIRTRPRPPAIVFYAVQPLVDRVVAKTDPAPAPLQRRTAIRRGARGPLVAEVQRLVGASPDGVYGPLTHAAVERWQERHGLPVTGVWGDTEWRSYG